MGCSLPDSAEPTRRSSSARSVPGPGTTSTRDMIPSVIVPVLSKTITSISRVASNTCGPLISRPSCEPRPVPTRRAVGVARPSAHGHAITNTATAAAMAASTGCPRASQAVRVAAAIRSTMGTNTADTRSARRCASALPAWASRTKRPMRASWVSDPTLVARISRRPDRLTVAPVIASPGTTSTGTDSPVSRLASMVLVPPVTSPSVGARSPGRTTRSCPTFTAEAGTVTSVPSAATTRASCAPSRSSERSAEPARRLALASAHRPPSRNVGTTAATSRYSS